MLQAVQLYQKAFVSVNRAGELANVAEVVDAAGQGVEIALFNSLQGGDAQLGDSGDLFERDPFLTSN